MWRMMVSLVLLAIAFSQEVFDEKDPREIIENVRIYRLTQELDLTTEQAAKFFPQLNELRKIEQNFQKERMATLRELKDLVKSNDSTAKITKAIKRYEAVQEQRATAQIKKTEEIKQVLTPLQQAKYLIFQEEFEREIREMIKEVRKHRPPRD